MHGKFHDIEVLNNHNYIAGQGLNDYSSNLLMNLFNVFMKYNYKHYYVIGSNV